jgi:hypothetical protein
MGAKSKRKKSVVVATPYDDDDDDDKKDAISLLSTLQNLLKCDGCQNAFFASSSTSSSSKREPITLHCGHTICRECGIRATEPRKGFYEAFCPSSTEATRCLERVFAKDFALEGEKVGERRVNIKMVEIAQRAKELEAKMEEEMRRRREGKEGEKAKSEGAKTASDGDDIRCRRSLTAATTPPMSTLIASFESEVLRKACEKAMEIMGDPDAPLTPEIDAGREAEEEREATVAKKLEEQRRVILAFASEREKSQAMEELSRTIEALKEKREKVRRARETLEEDAVRRKQEEEESKLRQKVTEEIDAMTINQLRARYVHMHGKAPVKGTTKSEYRKIFANVDPSVWLATTKYMEASRNRTTQSQDPQRQEEGVHVVRDSLGVGGGYAIAVTREGKGTTVMPKPTTTTTEATEITFHNPFSRLRSSTRINSKRRASMIFDIPEVFSLTTTSSSQTEQSVKDAAYDEILNQIMQCGKHAVVVKDDDQPLDDDVTHCIVTSGATIHADDASVNTKNGAKKKYIVKKRSVRYLESLARGIWIVSSEWIASRKGTKKYANEEEFEIYDAAGTWNVGTDGLLDVRIFNSASLHRRNKENYLKTYGSNENRNESGAFASSESDSLMLTRRARTAKEIVAAKNSGVFNGLKIVIDVPDFFVSPNGFDEKKTRQKSNATTTKAEWGICKSDCERIVESAGAEVLRERDYVVLDSYFRENETDSPVPDSEEEEEERGEQNIKQSEQQRRSKEDMKFNEEACASVDYVFLDGDAQTELRLIERTKKTFPNAKIVDWHWFVHSLVKGYTLETEDSYEMPLSVQYPRENFRF